MKEGGAKAIWYSPNLFGFTKKNRHQGPVIIYREPSGHVEIGIMSIPPKGKAAMEVHETSTQTLFILEGMGSVRSSDVTVIEIPLKEGTVVMIPAGTSHEIENIGTEPLKLFTTYSKDANEKWVH